jgi:hypothetical protein
MFNCGAAFLKIVEVVLQFSQMWVVYFSTLSESFDYEVLADDREEQTF